MTGQHKIMTIFKYIIIRFTIFFRQKTGTAEEIQKTEQKANQNRFSCSFCKIFLVVYNKKRGSSF